MLLRMYLRWAEAARLLRRARRGLARHRSRAQLGDVHGEGPVRVRLAHERARRAPPHPHLAVRRQRTSSDRVRVVRRGTGARRNRGARDRADRPAHRHVPFVGRGWAARERHGLGGAHHAPPDGDRRVVPERAVADPEQGARDADPRRHDSRSVNARSARPSSTRCRVTSATSRSEVRSGRTPCSRTSWSRTSARATRPGTCKPCSTVPSTTSSRRFSGGSAAGGRVPRRGCRGASC